MLQAGRSRIPVLKRSLKFSNLPNPSTSTLAIDLTQSLAEYQNTLLGSNARPARKADELTAIC
jgi:hypothetical protein